MTSCQWDTGSCVVIMVDQGATCAKNVLNFNFLVKLGGSTTSQTFTESVLRHKYIQNRLSMRAIANEFACSKTHVRDLLLRYKIPIREPHKAGSNARKYGKRKVNGQIVDYKKELKTIETIKKMYNEGLRPKAISRLLDTMKTPTKKQGRGWHHHTVITILKREGVYKMTSIS